MSLPRLRIEVISGGRITIPKKIREEFSIKEGTILEVYVCNKKIVMEVLVE